MRQTLKGALGNLLISANPQKAEQLSTLGMTSVDKQDLKMTERLMRFAMLQKIEQEQDFDALEALHKNYWMNRGSEYFLNTDDHFETIFLPECSFLIDILAEHVAGSESKFRSLLEIGTGNGDVLKYLSERLPSINTFTGVDLSHNQIDLNVEKFRDNPKLEFVAADGLEWVEQYAESDTIFFTSRGVLEYVTQSNLEKLLRTAAGLGNTIFVTLEPNGLDHDFAAEPNSKLYGLEKSFSHNYPAQMIQAGFDLIHMSEKRYEEQAHKLSFTIGMK
ncbi:MAG: class I SAM-dependent methyltransferase [Chloroflexota bacterium]